MTHVCMDTCDCLCIGLWFVRPWPPWTRFACITLLALVKRCTAVVVFPCRWIPSCSIKNQIDLRGFSQTTFTSPGPWPLKGHVSARAVSSAAQAVLPQGQNKIVGSQPRESPAQQNRHFGRCNWLRGPPAHRPQLSERRSRHLFTCLSRRCERGFAGCEAWQQWLLHQRVCRCIGCRNGRREE